MRVFWKKGVRGEDKAQEEVAGCESLPGRMVVWINQRQNFLRGGDDLKSMEVGLAKCKSWRNSGIFRRKQIMGKSKKSCSGHGNWT